MADEGQKSKAQSPFASLSVLTALPDTLSLTTEKHSPNLKRMRMRPRLLPSPPVRPEHPDGPALPQTALEQRLHLPPATAAGFPCPLPQLPTASAGGGEAAPRPLRPGPAPGARGGTPRSSLLPAASAGERVSEGRPPGLPRPPPALILLLPRSLHGGGSVPGGPGPEGRSGSPAAAAPHRPLRMGCVRTHICMYVLYLCVCAYIARICHLIPHHFSPARRGGRCLRGGVQRGAGCRS